MANEKSMESIAVLRAELPPPAARYAAPGVEFDVYRAKDLHAKKWNSPALKNILLLCRKSYRRYGNRPLLDEFDKKAAVYLVRARYSKRGIPCRMSHVACRIEEWLSIRMVPGDGRPTGVHEPEIFERGGKPVDYWMKKKIGARGFWRTVAGSQRMCGIHPYKMSSQPPAVGHRQLAAGGRSLAGAQHHRWTPVCFALMHRQFVHDYPLDKFPYRYITALIRPDYYRKGLGYAVRGREVRPVFTSADSFLGIRRGGIRVKRGVFSYQFPLYWFDARKLLQLVNRLRRKEQKPQLKALAPEMFYGITKQPHRPADIAGLRIEPARMKRLMDRLPDAPGLKITEAGKWYRSMEAILRAARVKARASS